MRRRLGERRASQARRRGLCSTCCWSSKRGDGGTAVGQVPSRLSTARRVALVALGASRFAARSN